MKSKSLIREVEIVRYDITNSHLISTRRLNFDIYYIYILTLLAKDDVPDKHMSLKTLFVTMNNTIDFYNFECIRIDRYYKGTLDEDISKLKYCNRKIKGTILLERDNDSYINYLKQNFYGSLSEEDIFELILQNI